MTRTISRLLTGIALTATLLFAGCHGDDFSSVDLTGQATFPPQFRTALGELVPVANSLFQVIDLSRGPNDNVVGVGVTDANGNYAVTVPATFSAAVVVLGDVRVSGLVDPRKGSVSKDFSGVTDLACEAGVTAVFDGSINAFDMNGGRIAVLEQTAAQVAAVTAIDYTDSDGSRTAAVQLIRQLTDDGAHLPE